MHTMNGNQVSKNPKNDKYKDNKGAEPKQKPR